MQIDDPTWGLFCSSLHLERGPLCERWLPSFQLPVTRQACVWDSDATMGAQGLCHNIFDLEMSSVINCSRCWAKKWFKFLDQGAAPPGPPLLEEENFLSLIKRSVWRPPLHIFLPKRLRFVGLRDTSVPVLNPKKPQRESQGTPLDPPGVPLAST